MKKTFKKLPWALGVLAGFVAVPLSASAATFSYADVDPIELSMSAGGPTGIYSGTFNFDPGDNDANFFTATGFGPASGSYASNFGYTIGTPIIEGTITFFFKDPADGSETGFVTAAFSNVGSITSFANYSVFSQGLEFSILTSISTDGKLDYTVTVDSGDLELVAGIGTIVVSVPDNGATIAMLGGSLLGMAAFKKRLSRRVKA